MSPNTNISKLLEKFNNWRADFVWPTLNQWRQFFHILNRREKHWLAGYALLALTGFLIFSGGLFWRLTEVKPDQGGSINVAIIGAPRFLNPVLNQTNDADRDVASVIFSRLLRYDKEGNLTNELAEKYSIGDNGKLYEVTIKKNVLWQDKKPLTVDDIIFTLQTIQNPEFNSPIRLLWQGVEIEKVDDWTLRFKLKNAYAAFLNNLNFGILPKHLWENVAPSQFALNEMNLKPIGSGPYQFVKFQKDNQGNVKSMEFRAFSKYFEGEPFITNLTFKFYANENETYTAYKKGEIDVFTFISAKNFADFKSKSNDSLTVYPLSVPRYFAVFFNQSQNKFLTDKNIRQAVTLATDKQEIINTVFSGYAQKLDSPLAPGMTGYSDQITSFAFAPDQAKNILATAGWQDSDGDGFLEKNNEKLELTLTAIDWPELAESATLLQKQWQAVGIKVNLDIKETADIQNSTIKPRQFQALLFGEVVGLEPDLFHFWHSSQKKESGLNLAMYENAEVDKLLSAGLADLDKNSRAQKNLQAVNLIVADLPAVFLFSPDYIFLAKKEIQGIDLNILDATASRFSSINNWYLKTHRTFK